MVAKACGLYNGANADQRAMLCFTAPCHCAVDQHALGELGPAVDDTVSDDLDTGECLLTVGMCFRQRLKRTAHCRRIIGHIDRAALHDNLLGGA